VIAPFRQGQTWEESRAQLNAMVEGLNAFLAATGDGIVTVARGAGSQTIGLNLSELAARMPRANLHNVRVHYGTPTVAFSTGATVILAPTDVAGTTLAGDNVTAYVQADQTAYTMTNSTTIPITAVLPYYVDAGGTAYLLGQPIEVVTTYQVDGSNAELEKKTRNVWVLGGGSESDWVVVHTGDTCS